MSYPEQPQYQGGHGQWQPQGPIYPTQAPMYQPYPPQPQVPPIVINNVVSASASAAAFAGGYRIRRKRQKLWVHLWLFLFTVGIGNAIYAWYVVDWNRKNGA